MGVSRLVEVLWVALRLGLTSFGGPVAHIGYFHQEYVVRRAWLSEERFAELVALCQFLPGPASSQLGIAIGTGRAGYLGGFLAWLGFTVPSAIALAAFAYGVHEFGGGAGGWLDGLKIAAVAVVAFALWGMGRSLTPDRTRITIAVIAAAGLLLTGGVVAQLAVIAGGAVLGLAFLRPAAAQSIDAGRRNAGAWFALVALAIFAVVLLALPAVARVTDSQPLAVADAFYRTGSLVFGGGHVVLPLLEAEVVSPGWVTKDEFLAGYGAAQAVPGPLFTFSAYLGTATGLFNPWWLGGLLALVAIFAPSFLLVWGVLPFWERVRGFAAVRRGLMGVNAAVVGVLLAALYDPVWTSAIAAPEHFALAAAAFTMLAFWRTPPWIVVALSASGGAALAAV